MTLCCEGCKASHDVKGDVPKKCPTCGQFTRWTAASWPDYAPILKLSKSDIAFLHQLNIDPQT